MDLQVFYYIIFLIAFLTEILFYFYKLVSGIGNNLLKIFL